jgi:cytochrome P450 family 142 subfamily A polypeptide 1
MLPCARRDVDGGPPVPAAPPDLAIDLLDGRFYAGDPQPAFAWMRAEAPLFRDEQNGLWAVSRHADVMRISKDPRTFCSSGSSRPDAPPMPSMINLDDPEHMRRRNLVNRGFTPRRIADHEPRVREICVELIERAAAKGRFDFVRDVAAPLPMIVIGDMLGVAPEDHDDLLRWSDDLLLGTSASASPEQRAGAQRAFEEYVSYHRRVAAERRARPTDDLVSVLVHAEIDGSRLSEDELLHESLLILVGGDETTRHVISGGMHQLLLHPDQREKLARDPAKIPTAVEEMLRWVTPIQNMNRTATRDVELHGRTIRRGDKVLLLYPSANRDEAVFSDPFRFDVEREPNDHVAFGGYGAHFCLGASLARLELRVMFEELLRRLPRVELASDEPPPRRPSNFIVGLESLPVRVD